MHVNSRFLRDVRLRHATKTKLCRRYMMSFSSETPSILQWRALVKAQNSKEYNFRTFIKNVVPKLAFISSKKYKYYMNGALFTRTSTSPTFWQGIVYIKSTGSTIMTNQILTIYHSLISHWQRGTKLMAQRGNTVSRKVFCMLEEREST